MLTHLLSHFVHSQDPARLRAFVYLVQATLGVGVIGLFLWKQQHGKPSGFRVREADLKKQSRSSVRKVAVDPLAEARLKKVLALGGISLSGAPHEILGVPATATRDEVQTAYRERMKHYHPDRVGRPGSREWQDASEIAQALQAAREKMLSRLNRNRP